MKIASGNFSSCDKLNSEAISTINPVAMCLCSHLDQICHPNICDRFPPNSTYLVLIISINKWISVQL